MIQQTQEGIYTKQSEIIKNETKRVQRNNKNRRGTQHRRGHLKEITEKNEIEMRRAINKHKTQMELQTGIIIIIRAELEALKMKWKK